MLGSMPCRKPSVLARNGKRAFLPSVPGRSVLRTAPNGTARSVSIAANFTTCTCTFKLASLVTLAGLARLQRRGQEGEGPVLGAYAGIHARIVRV